MAVCSVLEIPFNRTIVELKQTTGDMMDHLLDDF